VGIDSDRGLGGALGTGTGPLIRLRGLSPSSVLFSQQVSGGCTAGQPLGRAASGDYSECWDEGSWGIRRWARSSQICFSPHRQGLAANPSGYGPLTDLPDWSYADGRPAPPMKGQLRRKAEREKFARRVVLLSQEMDTGLQAWQLRQQKLQEEQRKKENALKSKGASLKSPFPSQ
uniref:Large ribosomal subunit protein mL52 n=1 Tax=Chlorocebus sabaeus TaxID=60711 RepID=A0A0D9RUM6_CHLSB